MIDISAIDGYNFREDLAREVVLEEGWNRVSWPS